MPSWYQEGWRDDEIERASDERRDRADEWDLHTRAVEQAVQDRLRDRGGLGESSLSERGTAGVSFPPASQERSPRKDLSVPAPRSESDEEAA